MLQSLIPYLHHSQTYLHQLFLRQRRGHPGRKNREAIFVVLYGFRKRPPMKVQHN